MSDYPEMIEFDGPCPFLLCLAIGPHEHPICPECGAVRYGNLSCDTCRKESLLERSVERLLTKEKSNDRAE